jgi:hypothetical protein
VAAVLEAGGDGTGDKGNQQHARLINIHPVTFYFVLAAHDEARQLECDDITIIGPNTTMRACAFQDGKRHHSA